MTPTITSDSVPEEEMGSERCSEPTEIGAQSAPAKDEIWIINITGYGSFVFRGDEEDCEFMRAGKCEWEGAGGSKWRAETVDLSAAGTRPLKTLRALIQAVKYPHSVADSSNYGPSPKKAERAAAVAGSEAAPPDANEAESRSQNP